MEDPRLNERPTEPPDCSWRQPSASIDYREMPADDYLAAARRADLALAAREAASCRRPVVDWNHDLTGPTEAWRTYLAVNDPEWVEDERAELGEVAA